MPRITFMNNLVYVALLAMAPISELRGAIPFGIASGPDFFSVWAIAVIFNIFVFFPIYFGLKLFYERFFSRFWWARKLIERVRRNGGPYIEKYGFWGLVIFVGTPLPITGAWTGTGAAWLMGLDWKKSFLAVSCGVIIASSIVSLVVLGFISGMEVFVK